MGRPVLRKARLVSAIRSEESRQCQHSFQQKAAGVLRAYFARLVPVFSACFLRKAEVRPVWCRMPWWTAVGHLRGRCVPVFNLRRSGAMVKKRLRAGARAIGGMRAHSPFEARSSHIAGICEQKK